jgi:hypothetical protein
VKALKKPTRDHSTTDALLDKFFPESEQKWSIVFTALTCCQALVEDINEAFEPHQISSKAKYSLIQYLCLRRLISSILTNKITSAEDVKMNYVPETDWDCEGDWEKKFIFIVKAFYKHLQDEGKI